MKYARDSLKIRREVRYATVRLFGCGAVRCGTICDRVRAKGPYGIEIDFEIRARTANSANFGKIQVFRLNRAEGILQCRRPLFNKANYPSSFSNSLRMAVERNPLL